MLITGALEDLFNGNQYIPQQNIDGLRAMGPKEAAAYAAYGTQAAESFGADINWTSRGRKRRKHVTSIDVTEREKRKALPEKAQ